MFTAAYPSLDNRPIVDFTHPPLEKMATILPNVIFWGIFLNEKFRILMNISLKFVHKGLIDNEQALV